MRALGTFPHVLLGRCLSAPRGGGWRAPAPEGGAAHPYVSERGGRCQVGKHTFPGPPDCTQSLCKPSVTRKYCTQGRIGPSDGNPLPDSSQGTCNLTSVIFSALKRIEWSQRTQEKQAGRVLRPMSSHRQALVEMIYQEHIGLQYVDLCTCTEPRQSPSCEGEQLPLIQPRWHIGEI